jgi:hypothetical protein
MRAQNQNQKYWLWNLSFFSFDFVSQRAEIDFMFFAHFVGKVRIISKNSDFLRTEIKNAYWLRGSECVNL